MSDEKTVIFNIYLWVWEDLGGQSPQGYAQAGSFISYLGGRILETGLWSNDARERLAGATFIDGNGSLALPGLADSHIHCAGLGESNYFVHLALSLIHI